jgi:hypothetical protein
MLSASALCLYLFFLIGTGKYGIRRKKRMPMTKLMKKTPA